MTEPKNVLFVAHSSNQGGAEYCLDTTLRHLDRTSINPITVFPFDGPMADSSRNLDIKTIISPMCHWLYFRKSTWYWKNLLTQTNRNVVKLAEIIEQNDIDLVYTNTSAIFESAQAARRLHVPHLWHIHEVLKPGNQMSQLLPIRWMQKLIRNYSSKLVFESYSARDTFHQSVSVPDAQVIHNSLRLPSVSRPSVNEIQTSRRHLGLPANKTIVAFAGQFFDRKNPELLIDGFNHLPEKKELHCVFVGDGPLLCNMQSKIATSGFSEHYTILPFQEDIRALMTACDILVLPSRQESFGLVLVEAAAYGKPAIACKSQGPCEIIVDGKTGLLVEQEDPHGLAKAIKILHENRDLQIKLGNQAFERTKLMFSAEVNTKKIEVLICQLIAEHLETGSKPEQ